jgi:hypothetical protein
MAAGKYNVLVECGATFKLTLILGAAGMPVNLTGYKARAQMREGYDAKEAFLTFTTDDGSIVFDAVAGKVTLIASAAATSAVQVDGGVWDLELVDPLGDVTRLLQGKVVVSPESTKITNV